MKVVLLSVVFSAFSLVAVADGSTSRADNSSRSLQAVDFEPGVVFNQPQCVIENGFDYSGNDIGSQPAPTPWDCCVPCSNTPGCNAYTWTNYNDGTCWFKSGRGTVNVNADARSAVMSSDEGCQLEQNINYEGNDITSVSASQARDCCTACTNTRGCRAYTFTSYNGGTCWLKSSKGQMVVSSGSTSGSPYVLAATCGLENGIDYTGNDIGSVRAAAPGSCCSICRAFTGCRAFTWSNADGGTCWLKNRKDGFTRKDGAVSGQSAANPPAPSCAIERNTDYTGPGIGSAKSGDAYGCCSICMKTPNCQAFSWSNYEGGTCWLKSAKGGTGSASGVMSAVV